MTIIKQSAKNMNNVKSEKYGISPNVNEDEEKSLSNQRFRTLFNFKRIDRSKNVSGRLDKYSRKNYIAKKKKLCNKLDVGEKVLVLAERIKKKTALGKFYKETVQNILFTIRKSKV